MAKGDSMQTKQKIILVFLLIIGFGILLLTPSLLDPVNAQVFYYTPTAEANGNIYYTVKQGDTCEGIAAINGVDLNVLRNLNNLDLDQCRLLQTGRLLLLGTVPTPMITAGPSPTPTTNLPTPEAPKGFGTICIYLYDDINGNAMAESEEVTNTGLAGGEFNLTNKTGDFIQMGTTINTGEAICYKDVPADEYTISIAIPDGYNPTSGQNYIINLKAGDTATVNFSAQASSSLTIVTEEGKSSVFLAVFGGLIVLAGIGLGLYARLIRRK